MQLAAGTALCWSTLPQRRWQGQLLPPAACRDPQLNWTGWGCLWQRSSKKSMTHCQAMCSSQSPHKTIGCILDMSISWHFREDRVLDCQASQEQQDPLLKLAVHLKSCGMEHLHAAVARQEDGLPCLAGAKSEHTLQASLMVQLHDYCNHSCLQMACPQ